MAVWLPITALLTFSLGYVSAVFISRQKFAKQLDSALVGLRDESRSCYWQNNLLEQSDADVSYKCSELEKDNSSAFEQLQRYTAS